MPVSSEDWIFGRCHATDSTNVTLLSYWRANDPADSQEQETQIVFCKGQSVNAVFVPFHCVDLVEGDGLDCDALLVGLEGDLAFVDGETVSFSRLDETDNGPLGRGDIRRLARIDSRIFAVGMQRQVYLKSEAEDGVWNHFEDGLHWQPDRMAGFNDICGFSWGELYAVGWRGDIHHFDGSRWSPLHALTNLKLQCCLAAPDGLVYAAGLKGVLLKGRGEAFEIIRHDLHEDSFQSLCWAFGQLWAVTPRGLFVLDGTELIAVDPGLGGGETFRCLSYAGGRLWSAGDDHVMYSEDGKKWSQIIF